MIADGMAAEIDVLKALLVALAVGLIVGLERGWESRNAAEGSRIAGLRTFGLIGLAGGLIAQIAIVLDATLAATVALGFAGLLIATRVGLRTGPDVGATTEVAALTTFCLGILAGVGLSASAIAAAVAVALLLRGKPALHRWLRAIDEQELSAILQLLVISLVVLPLLPNTQMGPYAALNPYHLWWMVVLVAGLSFAGYLAIRLVGPQAGLPLMGLAGGLISSTATVYALLKKAKAVELALQHPLMSAVLAATTVMLMRVALLAIALHPPLWSALVTPIGSMVLVAGGLTLWRARRGTSSLDHGLSFPHSNPLDLKAALGFGVVLAAVTVLVEAARTFFGTPGILSVSGLSGLVDVDAIALVLATQAGGSLADITVAEGLVIATLVNTLVKVGFAVAFCPSPMARRLSSDLSAVAVAGLIAATVQHVVSSS
jgi:uncharacterized membrane protein (DUF4010 family)